MALTPEQRTLRARKAALTRWSMANARADGAAQGRLGQDALLARFAREIDPEETLSATERHTLAVRRRDAHMAGLALASSRARAARTAEPKGGTDAEDVA